MNQSLNFPLYQLLSLSWNILILVDWHTLGVAEMIFESVIGIDPVKGEVLVFFKGWKLE